MLRKILQIHVAASQTLDRLAQEITKQQAHLGLPSAHV